MRSRKQREARRASNLRNGAAEPSLRFSAPGNHGASLHIQFTPLADIDLMIANGWGDVPQYKLPADWRERTRKEDARC